MTGSANYVSRTHSCAIRITLLAIAFVALAFTSIAAHAQMLYGSVTGTVTDKTGAVVPSVTVLLTNQGTGAVRTIQANAVGAYNILDVLPGMYTLTVNKTGNFAGFSQKNVEIDVNRQVRVDVVLQPASVSAEITVTEAPPMLQTETAEVTGQIDRTQLAQLPISSSEGRNFQALYNIIPGAVNVQEQNSQGGNPSRSFQANVNGMSYMSNATRIDGAVNVYGWLPYLIAFVPPADSIESVQVVTNAFNAEQGVAGGASINVSIKTGTSDFHGSAWEYYQDADFNARSYTFVTGAIPKNDFHQFGYSIGGPVYIPRIMTGRKKLFFFNDFERTTQRKVNSGLQTVPDSKMISGDFSEVPATFTSGTTTFNGLLYDPQPGGTGAYLAPGSRPTFASEYGTQYCSTGNCIPPSRISPAAQKMINLLAPISKIADATASNFISNQMANNYQGAAPYGYNRNSYDAKITYIPSDTTQVFGRYSWVPYSVTDPQVLGAAGGGTFDGGQPGAAQGTIRNAGLGMSHVFSPSLVLDADGGFTRQRTGAISPLDQSYGSYGLSTLNIPGTNGPTADYNGLPQFAFTGFAAIGNSNGANPFLFRDNQFTGDVNLSWIKGKHSTKYGLTFYHFDLNHFQPTSGGGVNNPRGAFSFLGGMTINTTSGYTAYNGLADFLLGLPNAGASVISSGTNFNSGAVGKVAALYDPNTLRWTQWGGYAQDQWSITNKMVINYGVRYDYYPMVYKDHEGVPILDPTLPQSANVEIGGLGENPKNSGVDVGHGMFEPRAGIAYRVTDKLIVRSGGGISEDPDSQRFMRDAYPFNESETFNSPTIGSIAQTPTGTPITLATGIPALPTPNISGLGYASLAVGSGTTTMPRTYRRGYIETWNLSVQDELGKGIVANIAYVGTHQVRQLAQTGFLNSSPLPDGTTPCMANGYFNPSTGLSGPCVGSGLPGYAANQIINKQWCTGTTNLACYNTGGIGTVMPLFSSNYNGLQSQLSRNGRNASFGLVYTWSHSFDYADNGAGSGSAGVAWNYPAYYKKNRATSGYDRTNNVQFWGLYHLPFGHGQAFANHGLAAAIFGGFQMSGQFSHFSGTPFSVAASNSNNAQGGQNYADLVAPYHQLGGHSRTVGNTAISGGKSWFDPTSFANPVQPTQPTGNVSSGVAPMVFGNTHRNQFRGPGETMFNMSAARSFPLYRETSFEFRAEATNLFNHPWLANPNATVGGSTFGYITSFSQNGYQNADRFLQFSGRFTF